MVRERVLFAVSNHTLSIPYCKATLRDRAGQNSLDLNPPIYLKTDQMRKKKIIACDETFKSIPLYARNSKGGKWRYLRWGKSQFTTKTNKIYFT